jgi:hypothetical protein
MSELRFTRPVVASGGHLRCKIIIDDAVEIDGKTFFNLAKGNPTVAPLLGLRSYTSENDKRHQRPLAKTNIIEHLQTLRDAEYIKHCQVAGTAAEDLGIDPVVPVAKKLKPRPDMPSICQVEAPSFGAIDTLVMNVVMSKPGLAVQLELTRDNIEYLSAVCKLQIDQGDIKREHPRSRVPEESRQELNVPGFSMVYVGKRAGQIRFSEKAGTTSRYIKPEGGEDLSATIERACKQFKASGCDDVLGAHNSMQ